MARVEACLVDAYDTIVHTDFAARRDELPTLAGIAPDAMYAEFRHLSPALSVGELSMAEAFDLILRASGVEPRPGLARDLADKARELLLSSARLYDDVLPFLRTLRSRGVKTAIVSNCNENTRPMLVALGVAGLADTLVLSCEVGAVKPTAPIFRDALRQLGVAAGAALFVDDTATYCAGAAALGISAVQMQRQDGDAAQMQRRDGDAAQMQRQDGGGIAAAGCRVVRSLHEVEPMIGS